MLGKDKRGSCALICNYKTFAKSKHSQVAIFVIIAVLIVAVLVVVYFLWRKPTVSISPEYDPQAYVEKCVKDAVEEAVDILMPRGGFITDQPSVRYMDINRTYLCYTNLYYTPCTNQRPHLTEDIEKEITDYVEPRVKECFRSLKEQLEQRSYVVDMGNLNLSTNIRPDRVEIKIERDTLLTKSGTTRSFDKFKVRTVSPIYSAAILAEEIVHQEAKFCNFEILNYMILYPKFSLDKFRNDDGITIYTLKDKLSGKEFVFAVRSCVLPAGL